MTNHGRRMTDKSPEQKETDLAKALDEWKAFTIKKFDEGAKEFKAVRESISENTQMTIEQSQTTNALKTDVAALKGDVGEVLAVVTALKGGKTVLGWGGRLFIWLGGLAGAWAAISAALHGEVRLPWQ